MKPLLIKSTSWRTGQPLPIAQIGRPHRGLMLRRRALILALYFAAILAAIGCVLPIGEPLQIRQPGPFQAGSFATFIDSSGHVVTRTFPAALRDGSVFTILPFSGFNILCFAMALALLATATGFLLLRSRKRFIVA